MTTDCIMFFVSGEPIPQGSSKAFVVNGVARITHANKRTDPWRQRIASEAQHEQQRRMANGIEPFFEIGDLSYTLELEFVFTRPKSYSKKWFYFHTKRPDLDKTIRACLDALTDVLFEDDAMVRSLLASKRYLDPGIEGDLPGLHVQVQKWPGRLEKVA